MSERPQVKPFEYSPEDPLAGAHAIVSAWCEDRVDTPDMEFNYVLLKLEDSEAGQRILNGSPRESLDYFLAATIQKEYWDAFFIELRELTWKTAPKAQAADDESQCSRREFRAEMVFAPLLKKPLPFQKGDFVQFIHWGLKGENLWKIRDLMPHVIKDFETCLTSEMLDDSFRALLENFMREVRKSVSSKFEVRLQKLLAKLSEKYAVAPPADSERLPIPRPAMFGNPYVFYGLKFKLGILSEDQFSETELIGPDAFPFAKKSPLLKEHALLSMDVAELLTLKEGKEVLNNFTSGIKKRLSDLSPSELTRLMLATCERMQHLEAMPHLPGPISLKLRGGRAFTKLIEEIRKKEFETSREITLDWILYGLTACQDSEEVINESIQTAERLREERPFSEGERFLLHLLRRSVPCGLALGEPPLPVVRLNKLIGDDLAFVMKPGEVWADTINEWLTGFSRAERDQWIELLKRLLPGTASKPSAKWIKDVRSLVAAVPQEQVYTLWELVLRGVRVENRASPYNWLVPATQYFHVDSNFNLQVLLGCLWGVQTLPDPSMFARDVTGVGLWAYKKIPGRGPRAAKVGNAAVYALSQLGTLEALGQLAMLKVRVKSVPAQKEIEKAFNTLSGTLGLPREEIEELGVPSYGLEEVGLLSEELGEYRGEVRVDGSSVQLKWFDAKGKELKSVPAKVKAEHKEELKDLQQSVKDITGMLPAQRERLDGMFCSRKTWKYSVWRERYLDHPLVGTIARRLIWNVGERSAIFSEGRLVDRNGNEVVAEGDMEVSLWHPIGRSVEEITGWRERLEGLGITQPFKQAHREIYLLTDAERTTNVYSNRFAAHIIRQHQFNALCGVRGWKNKLRMMVDAEYPPAEKHLPEWGLRAEYWIEGIGENYGTDSNEAGAFLRLATDQVRFYRTGAARNESQAGEGRYVAGRREELGAEDRPIPLEEIPPLVFSEVMRDVDLFVGVCSVANDPTWQDGGVVPEYRTYWENYSFGELSGGSRIRKEVLERLIPRLKIADRCTFAERFLVVKGSKRTYKIHLGSGNILMEPNDQYLCIVPDSKSKVVQGDLYLPFEGDNMLSIILSKALLLAEDGKIKDPTIVRQIEGV